MKKVLKRVRMPLIGDGSNTAFRPAYGGPGYHFRIRPLPDGYCECTELVNVPFPSEILEEEDVEILEGGEEIEAPEAEGVEELEKAVIGSTLDEKDAENLLNQNTRTVLKKLGDVHNEDDYGLLLEKEDAGRNRLRVLRAIKKRLKKH